MTKLDAGLMTSLPASDPGSVAVWGSKRINPQAPVLFVSDLEWIPFKRRQRFLVSLTFLLSKPETCNLTIHFAAIGQLQHRLPLQLNN